jgi:hypothetical protein
MVASVVPAGVQPTSTPAMAAPTPVDTPAPALSPVSEAGAPAGAAAPQPASAVRTASHPPVLTTVPRASIVAESTEGTSPGTGGVQARAEQSAQAAASPLRRTALHVRRHTLAPARRGGFALRPGASTAPLVEASQTGSATTSLTAALGPLAAAAPLTGADTLVTLMVLLGGALLIALMCADALGVGPRHDYLRRHVIHHRWPPWR